MYNVVDVWWHGQGFWDTMFRTITAAYVFTVNLQEHCRASRLFYDITSYCMRSSQCDSMEVYIYNIGKNMFTIVINILQILETVIVQASPISLKATKTKYETIGSCLSRLFSSVIDLKTDQLIGSKAVKML